MRPRSFSRVVWPPEVMAVRAPGNIRPAPAPSRVAAMRRARSGERQEPRAFFVDILYDAKKGGCGMKSDEPADGEAPGARPAPPPGHATPRPVVPAGGLR